MSAVPSTQHRSDRTVPPEQESPAKLPGFLDKASKITQLALATILAVAAIGCFAIGIALGPFAPHVGTAAMAASATLLTMAGLLFFKALGKD